MQYDDNIIQLYQDLSPITLQQRQTLRPLLDSLRSRGILYSWRFPFALAATVEGRTVVLQSPAGMADFCDNLRILFCRDPRLVSWRPWRPNKKLLEVPNAPHAAEIPIAQQAPWGPLPSGVRRQASRSRARSKRSPGKPRCPHTGLKIHCTHI